jgi:hypothetical protein
MSPLPMGLKQGKRKVKLTRSTVGRYQSLDTCLSNLYLWRTPGIPTCHEGVYVLTPVVSNVNQTGIGKRSRVARTKFGILTL